MQDYLQKPIHLGDTVLTMSKHTNAFYVATVVEINADKVVIQVTPTCPRVIKNNSDTLVIVDSLAITTQKYPEHYL